MIISRRATSTKTRIETHRQCPARNRDPGRRATSTKTRIETHRWWTPPCGGGSRRRATSTKTRIETHDVFTAHPVCDQVAEQHPLKQGLKQERSRSIRVCWIVVAEQHPLKQGLKHVCRGVWYQTHPVAEQHPLKQGLKRFTPAARPEVFSCRRATSTKTRIETSTILAQTVRSSSSQSNIH